MVGDVGRLLGARRATAPGHTLSACPTHKSLRLGRSPPLRLSFVCLGSASDPSNHSQMLGALFGHLRCETYPTVKGVDLQPGTNPAGRIQLKQSSLVLLAVAWCRFAWFGLACLASALHGLAWPVRLAWLWAWFSSLAWLGLARLGLAWTGLPWLDLAGLGTAWLGLGPRLAWPGLPSVG